MADEVPVGDVVLNLQSVKQTIANLASELQLDFEVQPAINARTLLREWC
jgi:hypothetical protein